MASDNDPITQTQGNQIIGLLERILEVVGEINKSIPGDLEMTE